MIIKSVQKIFLLDSTISKQTEYVAGDLKGCRKKKEGLNDKKKN